MPEPVRDIVSVVIPARGEEPYLLEAVGSALAQPATAEVVVAGVDGDAPSARAMSAHPDPRVRFVVSAGPSAGENLDAGVAVTTRPWLAFLDADDRWPADRLALGLAAFAADPALDLCTGRQQAMDHEGALGGQVVPAPILGAVLVRRDAADRVGGFGDDLVAQMRWLLRARSVGLKTLQLDDVVLHRRAHPGNLSRVQRPELNQAYLALARESVARARAERPESSP